MIYFEFNGLCFIEFELIFIVMQRVGKWRFWCKKVAGCRGGRSRGTRTYSAIEIACQRHSDISVDVFRAILATVDRTQLGDLNEKGLGLIHMLATNRYRHRYRPPGGHLGGKATRTARGKRG